MCNLEGTGYFKLIKPNTVDLVPLKKNATISSKTGHFWVYSGMVEIEKSFKIEIKIYRIEIFRTEIEIGFYQIGFLHFCFRFWYNFGISKNYDSIYFDTKFNRCYFDKYRIVSVL